MNEIQFSALLVIGGIVVGLMINIVIKLNEISERLGKIKWHLS